MTTQAMATTYPVTQCTEASLRTAFNKAVNDGDLVVMETPLSCSTITLTEGALATSHNIYLFGPAYAPGAPAGVALTISGGGTDRVIKHTGTGTLAIYGLTIAAGYNGSTTPAGGCIYSAANVFLQNSTVSNCIVATSSASVTAKGGGVYTKGNLSLNGSTLYENVAEEGIAGARGGMGGGACVYGNLTISNSTISKNIVRDGVEGGNGGGARIVGNLTSVYSTVSGNQAIGSSVGGGLYLIGASNIKRSTISGNSAGEAGGGLITRPYSTTTIVESTISGNVTNTRGGGINASGPLTVRNSTIAFNESGVGNLEGSGGGIYFSSNTELLTLESSIVADNTGDDGIADDLAGNMLGVESTGYNNLIDASSIGIPGGASSIGPNVCPLLGPLADNGGPTLTHELVYNGTSGNNSPALGTGVDVGDAEWDQRGSININNFQRKRPAGTGVTDIGAFEVQSSTPGSTVPLQSNRIFVSGFESVCDH